MKLSIPPLEIDENEGFLGEKDIFQRAEFGTHLMNLILNNEEELVVALDSPWGEGKTTFVKMWRGLLNRNDISSIYFDAFSNDYQEDPFLTLAGEVYSLIGQDKKSKDEFKEKAISVFKTLSRASVRIGVKALTAGVLDETIFDIGDIVKDSSKESTTIIDNILSKRLDSVQSDKNSLKNFKVFLEDLAVTTGNDKPIVFIVDELDRCTPEFALKLIEKIKHLFSVPHIVFILVMNRSQIEESIRHQYGLKIDATKYLQKFVNLWVTLPKKKKISDTSSDAGLYLSYCLGRMDYSIESDKGQGILEFYRDLVDHYKMSLREIERSLTYFAIINNVGPSDLNEDYLKIGVYLSIIKVLFPKVYFDLIKETISYEQLIKETNLTHLSSNWWKDKPENHELKWMLRFFMSNKTQRHDLLQKETPINIPGRFQNMILRVCNWIESFEVISNT